MRIWEASPKIGHNTPSVLACEIRHSYNAVMRDEAEIRQALLVRDIRQEEIGRVLGWPQPRVSEWFAGKRKNGIRYDEGRKLIDAFDLGEGDEDPTLPSVQWLKLVVRRLAARIGAPLAKDDPEVPNLARTLQSSIAIALDPTTAETLERLVEQDEEAFREQHDTAAA